MPNLKSFIDYHEKMASHYTIKKDVMFYVGTATKRTYKKPFNLDIAKRIKNLSFNDYKNTQIINQYFMQK